MIHIDAAKELLDFGARIGDPRRGLEQLEGAVALHNILEKERVAYLADEVGMGKTYVALGALALFRHYHPGFRVLVIAPRENIQKKWMKEHENFVAHNVRFPDMRVKAIGGRTARPQVFCDRLATLAREASANPNRDFFARMTSFSLALNDSGADDSRSWGTLREEMRGALPWLDSAVFRGSTKRVMKDNIARALCCALPVFDLVIIDEAHNLKYGFKEDSAARNRVLSLALGHPRGTGDATLFPGYGPRARRVLFLSATPIDGAWRHLYNQLDVAGRAESFPELEHEPETQEEIEAVKAAARRILVRRVTCMKVGANDLTKNLYRREWRRGGVVDHDVPIRVTDDKQRLVLALVQKKVSELINTEKFNSSFQIGMLASFESFLQTAKVKNDEGAPANFDDHDQTQDDTEREGIDVHIVNKIAKDHRERFGTELPHPKMDALVDRLSRSWMDGRKSLVFVRRVASVKELKRKLDDRYDEWLFDRLRSELPAEVQGKLDATTKRYVEEKRAARETGEDANEIQGDGGRKRKADADTGGIDTFFAWFFRGAGPKGVVSGAAVQKRFASANSAYGTFFERNHVADALGVAPGQVTAALAAALQMSEAEVRREVALRMVPFVARSARTKRGERFEAAQAAAIELLKDAAGPAQEWARALWHMRYDGFHKHPHTTEVPVLDDLLETKTFFTELRARPELCEALWPSRPVDAGTRVVEQERRAMMLSATARLGHSFIDLYVLLIGRLKSLDARAQEEDAEEGSLSADFVAMLDEQRRAGGSTWRAYQELSSVATCYELLVDTNAQEITKKDLNDVPATLGAFMQRQQPVGGMSGSINGRLVKQFRMPGYPFVLVTTDLLQEGEDLHTFCSDVYHYGIAWTPSAMEQRIGRIDRVRSQTDRRMAAMTAMPDGADKLQVLYPHLEDTVEKLQVDVVLDRMDLFLRLMHEGLTPAAFDERRVDVGRALMARPRLTEGIDRPLQTAFPVDKALARGDVKALAVLPEKVEADLKRFSEMKHTLEAASGLTIRWEESSAPGSLLGTVLLHRTHGLASRQQPFVLTLRSVNDLLVVRCVSPVGQVLASADETAIEEMAAACEARIGAVLDVEGDRYDLTVEDDVVLGPVSTDARRVAAMLTRVVRSADQIEQEELPGKDQALADFKPHIDREVVPDDA